MANKSLKDILTESKKEYNYTIKVACDAITDAMLDGVERSLGKEGILSATAFKETPIQESPLDFPNVRNSKVFISDISLEYPSTSDLIRNKLSQGLNVSEQQVAVYTENDPRRANTEQYLEFLEGDKKEYVPYVGKDYGEDVQPEIPPYGDEHNKSFIQELMDSREEPNYVHNDLSPEQVIDHSHLDAQGEFSEPPVEKTLFGRTKKAEIE